MANENRYYKTPFAASGNKAEVPDVSTAGAVGYDTGFGPDYELPQGAGNRKRIERNMYNGVLNGITKNLKQFQEGLYPTWIEDNGTGVAYSYPQNMIVAHNGQDYVSNQAANQEEPGTGIKWSVYAALRASQIKEDSTQRQATAALENGGTFLVIGDSISVGNNASTYKQSYLYKLMRSITNHLHGDDSADSSFGYEVNMNMNRVLATPGVVSTGSIVATGAVNSRLELNAGEYIEVSGRTASQLDVFYDGDTTTGTATYSLDGTDYNIKNLSGSPTGTNSTFPTLPLGGQNTSPNEVLRITASGGNIVITGLISFRSSTSSPKLINAASSGWKFSDYLVPSRVTEISDVANTYKTAGSVTTLFIALGTNSMFAGAALAQTPADYITSLTAVISAYSAVITGLVPLLQVPLRANETTWPLTYATYDEYVSAIVAFAKTNNYQVVRFDQTSIDPAFGYMPDGLHPSNLGMSLMNNEICKELGIAPNNVDILNDPASCETRINVVGMSGLWGDFAGDVNFGVRAHRTGNVVHMSGLAASNGSTITTVGTLGLGFRPKIAQFQTVRAGGGVTSVDVDISTGGVITVSAIATNYTSFQNVSFVVDIDL
tara:strand:- start:935 stop:2746 length:1812 start_codon:yes stop_codon:yes gene_type:complete